MILIESFLFFAVLTTAVLLTLFATYRIYRKTRRKGRSLLATGVLFFLGIAMMVYMWITQVAVVDSWIMLAMYIMGMVLAITIVVSLVLSFLIFYLVDHVYFPKDKKEKHL